MSKIIDKEQAQASLGRAARLAASGALSGSNGRAEDAIADVARRLRDEMRIAMLNWATVEAFNSRFEGFRDDLKTENAWQPAMFAMRAVARDVLLALMRVTDGPGQDDDCQTLPRIVAMFDGQDAAAIAAATGAEESDVSAGLSYLRERVPRYWGKKEPLPVNRELAELREIFRPIRNRLLAHAQVYSSLDLRRDMHKAGEFLRLTSSLSDAACMICNVPRDDLQERWQNSFEEATHFWEIVAAGAKHTETV